MCPSNECCITLLYSCSHGTCRKKKNNYSLCPQGVTFAVAAGNEDVNACDVSPASAYYAFTVAASDENDRFASFSNYGYCVSIIAPVSSLCVYLDILVVTAISLNHTQ